VNEKKKGEEEREGQLRKAKEGKRRGRGGTERERVGCGKWMEKKWNGGKEVEWREKKKNLPLLGGRALERKKNLPFLASHT
jgi:hypothetical protein